MIEAGPNIPTPPTPFTKKTANSTVITSDILEHQKKKLKHVLTNENRNDVITKEIRQKGFAMTEHNLQNPLAPIFPNISSMDPKYSTNMLPLTPHLRPLFLRTPLLPKIHKDDNICSVSLIFHSFQQFQ